MFIFGLIILSVIAALVGFIAWILHGLKSLANLDSKR